MSDYIRPHPKGSFTAVSASAVTSILTPYWMNSKTLLILIIKSLFKESYRISTGTCMRSDDAADGCDGL